MAHCSIRHEDLSNSEISQRCFDPDHQIVGGLFERNLVVKLSEEVVVKFGSGVIVEGAENQRKALELLDCSIVRVPRLYRYFTQSRRHGYPPTGFIVMEYFHGEVLQLPITGSQIDQIAQILSYFSSIHR